MEHKKDLRYQYLARFLENYFFFYVEKLDKTLDTVSTEDILGIIGRVLEAHVVMLAKVEPRKDLSLRLRSVLVLDHKSKEDFKIVDQGGTDIVIRGEIHDYENREKEVPQPLMSLGLIRYYITPKLRLYSSDVSYNDPISAKEDYCLVFGWRSSYEGNEENEAQTYSTEVIEVLVRQVEIAINLSKLKEDRDTRIKRTWYEAKFCVGSRELLRREADEVIPFLKEEEHKAVAISDYLDAILERAIIPTRQKVFDLPHGEPGAANESKDHRRD